MGMISYISAVVVLCFTVSFFHAISGDTNIDCTKLDNITCCVNPGCFYVNCTDKKNTSLVHEGCHTSGNTAEVDAVCVASTVNHLCDGPEKGTCEAFLSNTTCCNNETLPDCTWINCTDIKTLEIHQGCHNFSDTAAIGAVCKASTVDNTCPAAPVEKPCKDYLKNQTACCEEKDRGCIFVTCTKDAKKFDGCYLNTDVTCASRIDQCVAKTTVAPVTTPAPIPLFGECQLYNDSKQCCSENIYSCINVNCTGGGITYQGCYSKSNETEIQTACSTAYLNTCAGPTTPVPPTTAAPPPGGKTGRHFDGASFIGGIVLCAGIVLIIFFAVKWYKSRQTSNNYHQM